MNNLKDNITIPEYFDLMGFEYDFDCHSKGKNHYRLREHTSLIFTDKYFWWNSKPNCQGDIYQLIMELENITYPKAYLRLEDILKMPKGKEKMYKRTNNLGHKKNCPLVSPPKTVPDEVYVYNKKYIKNVFAYLTKTRLINNTIISKFINDNNLIGDNKRNACFIIRDYKTNDIVGYEKHTTRPNIKWKGVSKNIPSYLCFNVRIGTPKTIIAFESAIDLLSYYQLNVNTLDNVILVSLRGKSIKAIQKVLDNFTIGNITLAIDNDKTTLDFITTALKALNNYNVNIDIPKHHKDWNDALKSKLEA